MNMLFGALGMCLNFCYNLVNSYGWAIVLFTFLSKIVLLPVSVWVQKNSIKMVRMQPEINRIKIKYYGDKDTIDDKQSEIYKREKYNPFASVIPLTIQILLLIGLVAVIRDASKYIQIKDGILETGFYGFDLAVIPAYTGGKSIVVPFVAGLSAFLLSVFQNKNNILQTEQSKAGKYGMMAFSVGLSLYLGFFVPAGVALYWICSNLFAIVQQYFLNFVINPKKYVDFEELEKTRAELAKYQNIDSKKKISREDKKREKRDYKRFFSVVNKHLVFYSEGSGFYKYYQGIIEYLIKNTNIVIHYITSDPNDAIFKLSEKEPQIHPYYIGTNKLITLMLKLDADIFATTTPDLETYYMKRSYVRKDVEYIHIPHTMSSMNLVYRFKSIDNFDTVFLVGKHQMEETRKTEEYYNLPAKKLIECGYPLLDTMIEQYNTEERQVKEEKMILIAPSWQKDNIMDFCIEELLDSLKNSRYKVIVRPHPQYVRYKAERLNELKNIYSDAGNIEIQDDFSANNTVYDADIIISDWSGIVYEYVFTTFRPVLFINTPMKIHNKEYDKIGVTPINVWMRETIGASLNMDELNKTLDTVNRLVGSYNDYLERNKKFASEYVYHIGNSAEIASKYIIGQIQKQIEKRKGQVD